METGEQTTDAEDQLATYRKYLVDTLGVLNESYDKILVTLAGGALALSIAFLKDIIKLENTVGSILLLVAWFLFITSLATVLGRILFGIEAHRRAITQVDDGTIRTDKPGGKFATITVILFRTSAASLIAGLICIAAFSYFNLGTNNVSGKTEESTKACTEAGGKTTETR